jgi:hypothetical protein
VKGTFSKSEMFREKGGKNLLFLEKSISFSKIELR